MRTLESFLTGGPNSAPPRQIGGNPVLAGANRAAFDSRRPSAYYGVIRSHAYEFPITSIGLIVNTTDYRLDDTSHDTWHDALTDALKAADHLCEVIRFFDSNKIELKSEVQTRLYARTAQLEFYYSNPFVVMDWVDDGWLRLPQELQWFYESYRERLTPPAQHVAPFHVPAPMPSDPGYVYLIQSPTGTYKIGRTRNPKDRIKMFSVRLPFEIELLHLIECDNHRIAEKRLHARFAAKRVNDSEFFALDAEDVAYIMSIKRM